MKSKKLFSVFSSLLLASVMTVSPFTALAASDETTRDKTSVGLEKSAESDSDTVTYYFLAPDDYFATNERVGYYYWQPSEIAVWPGAEATPAPEIGENVFKIECGDMDSTSTIIFNAYVDAGSPADPELAKHAHQSVNINLEGYWKNESEIYPDGLDDFYGMIYVYANDDAHRHVNEFSGATTTAGEWFSVDPKSEYYYKNFDEYYGSYNLGEATPDTPYVPEKPSTSDTDSSDDAQTEDRPSYDNVEFKAGEVLSVDYRIGGIYDIGCFRGTVNYNSDLLKLNNAELLAGDVKAVNTEEEGVVQAAALFESTVPEIAFSVEDAPILNLEFVVKENCNYSDLGISFATEELVYFENDEMQKLVFVGEGDDLWTTLVVESDDIIVTVDPSGDYSVERKDIGDSEDTVYHAGDIINVKYIIKDIDIVGAVTCDLIYNPDYLMYFDEYSINPEVSVSMTAVNGTSFDTISFSAIFGTDGSDIFADENGAALFDFKFMLLKDTDSIPIFPDVKDFSYIKDGKVVQIGLDGDYSIYDHIELSFSVGDFEKPEPDSDSDSDERNPDTDDLDTHLHVGDTLTVDYIIRNVDNLGAVTAYLYYDVDSLELVSSKPNEQLSSGALIFTNDYSGFIDIAGTFGVKGVNDFAGSDGEVLCTFTFNVTKDTDFMLFIHDISDIAYINDNNVVERVDLSEGADYYYVLDVEVDCPHGGAVTDIDTVTDIDSDDVPSETPDVPDSDSDSDSDPTTDAPDQVIETATDAHVATDEDTESETDSETTDVPETPDVPGETDSDTESETDSETTDVPETPDVPDETDSDTESETDSETTDVPETPDVPDETDSDSETDTEPTPDPKPDPEPDPEPDPDPKGMLGDLDGDEEITSNDAIIALRYSIGADDYDDSVIAIADIDGDEEITSNDAILILRMSIGM